MSITARLKLLEQDNDLLRRENQELKRELKRSQELVKQLSGLKSWYSDRSKKNKLPKQGQSPEDQKRKHLKTINQNRGAKQGHKGQNRRRDEAYQHIHLKLSQCPHCGVAIKGNQSKRYSRQLLELAFVPMIQLLEYHFYQVHCCFCQQTVHTGMKDLTGVSKNQYLGNRLKAFIGLLRHDLNQSISQIYRLVNFMAGYDFDKEIVSMGEIAETYLEVKEYGKKAREQILTEIRGSPYSHWDETGISCGGSRGYTWLGKTQTAAYYQVEVTRGSKVVEGLLGRNYQGVVVADYYSGYRSSKYQIQRCWVHLLRRVKKATEADENNQELAYLKRRLERMYQTFTAGQYQAELRQSEGFRIKSKKRFERWTRMIINHFDYQHQKSKQIIKSLTRHFNELFVFLNHPEIPAHNNTAEHSIRRIARFRDNCNGVQSESGMLALATGKTLVETFKLRQMNQFDAFVNLISTNC